jgi:hypothetical protein
MNKINIRLPDFIIVGAMKSGTSTLAHYLENQNGIFMPSDEVHFFDAYGGYADRWEKGLEWYSALFDDAKESDILGEKTPTYCYLNETPKLIKQTIPDVKLIWIFRNPVDRTYSNYWHAVRSGVETRSFRYAVEHENERIKNDIFKGYVQRSIYIDQIENYLQYFDLKDMYFTTLESLKGDLLKTLEEICNFIGADIQELNIAEEKPKAKNSAYFPKFMGLRRFTYNVFGKRSVISKIERKLNKKRSPGYPPMDTNLRKKLIEIFREPNEKLQDLTGLNTEEWNK